MPFPPYGPNPLARDFTTMTSICGDSVNGMGYGCDGEGFLDLPNPRPRLFNGPPDSTYLQIACTEWCWCPDIAPNIGSPLHPARPDQCIINNVEDDAADAAAAPCTGTNLREPITSNNIKCSTFYGIPLDTDCDGANGGLSYTTSVRTEFEFLDENANPKFWGLERVRTPKSWTTGMQLTMSDQSRHC